MRISMASVALLSVRASHGQRLKATLSGSSKGVLWGDLVPQFVTSNRLNWQHGWWHFELAH
eukprot:5483264-Amphidinium_carterae.1